MLKLFCCRHDSLRKFLQAKLPPLVTIVFRSELPEKFSLARDIHRVNINLPGGSFKPPLVTSPTSGKIETRSRHFQAGFRNSREVEFFFNSASQSHFVIHLTVLPDVGYLLSIGR